MLSRKWLVALLSVLVLLCMLVTLVGCATSPSSTVAPATPVTTAPIKSTASSATQVAPAGSSKLAEFNAKVDKEYAKATDITAPITLSDKGPKAVSGKRIVYVPILAASEMSKAFADACTAAAKVLGWEFTTIDPQMNLSKMTDALDNAATMKADGVCTFSIDSKEVPEPLIRLKKAGIALGSYGSFENYSGGKLYDFMGQSESFSRQQGYLMGVSAYKLSGGHIKALVMAGRGAVTDEERRLGFEQFVQECSDAGGDCKILHKIEFNVNDAVAQVPGLAVSSARTYPDYNVITGASDTMLLGVMGSLNDAGLSDPQKIVIGAGGTSTMLELIRKGTMVKASIGVPYGVAAWNVIDDFNRMFAGEKPLGGDARGLRAYIIDASNVPAKGTSWEAANLPVVEKHFKALWGK